MNYEIEIRTRAEKDLRGVPKDQAVVITKKVQALAGGLKGDVKRLTHFTPEYRLRVGDWRVLFDIEGNRVIIQRIVHRREAYR
jgi:mRNA interferase RelE/StbE